MNQLRKASFRNRQFRFESAGRNGHQRRALARRCPVGCRSRITPRAELSELRELSHAQRRAAYTSVEGAKERVLHTSEREKDDARSDFLAGQQPAWFVLTVGRNCAWLSAVDAGRSSDFWVYFEIFSQQNQETSKHTSAHGFPACDSKQRLMFRLRTFSCPAPCFLYILMVA